MLDAIFFSLASTMSLRQMNVLLIKSEEDNKASAHQEKYRQFLFVVLNESQRL